MTDSGRHSKESGVTARLKELLENISTFIDDTPEDQQRALLGLLEDWHHGHRRKHPRKPCSIAVDYAIRDRVFKDFIQNISAGGVFIETRMPFSVGQEITLTFSSSTYEDPVKITGEVAWSGPRGIGVKFKMATQAQYIKAMLKSL